MKDAWNPPELSIKDTATLLIALRYWIKYGAPVTDEAYQDLGFPQDLEVRAGDDCEELLQTLQLPFDKG